MIDEFAQGISEGRYIRLERGWAIPSRWTGALIVFESRNDRFGVLVKSKSGVWRCYFGLLEHNGMYGQSWWEEHEDMIVADFKEGITQLEDSLVRTDR